MIDAALVTETLDRAESLLTAAEADCAAGRDFDLAEFNATLTLACDGAVRLRPDDHPLIRARLARLEAFRRTFMAHAGAPPPAAAG